VYNSSNGRITFASLFSFSIKRLDAKYPKSLRLFPKVGNEVYETERSHVFYFPAGTTSAADQIRSNATFRRQMPRPGDGVWDGRPGRARRLPSRTDDGPRSDRPAGPTSGSPIAGRRAARRTGAGPGASRQAPASDRTGGGPGRARHRSYAGCGLPTC